jgi:hypothetical protein
LPRRSFQPTQQRIRNARSYAAGGRPHVAVIAGAFFQAAANNHCKDFTMNRIHTSRVLAAAAAVVALSSSAWAADGSVKSEQPRADLPTYGANVSAERATDVSPTPGPYAKYLMHVGASREDAIAQAASIDRVQVNAVYATRAAKNKAARNAS